MVAIFILSILSLALPMPLTSPSLAAPAAGFVDLSEVAPSIHVGMLYTQEWNFTGHKVPGYLANKCFLSLPAAKALAQVQKELETRSYSLWVTDCYRPRRAVADFVKWAEDAQDLKMQKIFYPEVPKSELFKRGYIAAQSGHSRGSTLDLTIIKIPTLAEKKSFLQNEIYFRKNLKDCRSTTSITQTLQLDMGTTVDCLDVTANTDHEPLSEGAKSNRKLLKSVMKKYNFINYDKEWWHYTLKDEPYPNQYFDFTVE